MAGIDFRGLGMDASDVKRLADFWCAAAGYEVETAGYPYYAVLDPGLRRAPRIIVVAVPEGKTSKNRLHLEFDAPNPLQEAERIVRLGAQFVAEHKMHGAHWVVMHDPEGNEFCLVDH